MAETVKYLPGGVITIPKPIREELGWGPGTELVIERASDEITLRRKPEIGVDESRKVGAKKVMHPSLRDKS